MLEARRDFATMRDLNTSAIHAQSPFGGSESAESLRVVFMLSDDFDLFKIDQEVVYDSAIDTRLGSKATTIQDEIQRVNGEKYLRQCFKEGFLELICILVKDKDPRKATNLLA